MENEYRCIKILNQDFFVPKSQTASEDTCLTINLMMQQAFLSIGFLSSAKKCRETYRFILECCQLLLSYDEKHLIPKVLQDDEKQ